MTTANNYPTSASILTFPGCIEVKVISDKMYIARHRTYLIRYMYIQYTYRAVLHSKSHQKSIKCQNFLRGWHFHIYRIRYVLCIAIYILSDITLTSIHLGKVNIDALVGWLLAVVKYKTFFYFQ